MSQAMPFSEVAAMVEAYVADQLDGAKIILVTNEVEAGPTLDAESLIEPSGDWYARADAVTGEPYRTEDDSISIQCESNQFNYTGSDLAETIRGVAVVTVVAGPPEVLTLKWYEALEQPVSMGGVLDSVIVAPKLTIPVIS